MPPKVSICIPAYKRVSLLRKALESVLEQSFADYEIIITDDSPDDEVKKLIDELKINKGIKYFYNSPALGSPANWNYAISKAEGEYIKLLHCDDFFLSPYSLAKYVELLDRNPSADFAFSARKVVTIPGNNITYYSCSKMQLEKIKTHPGYLFFRNLIGGPSATIYRRKILAAYDESLIWLVDIEFYMRLINMNHTISYTEEPLICTIDGGEEQITQAVIKNKAIQIKEHVSIFEKLVNTTKINRKHFSFFFRLLFNQYKVTDLETLQSICDIPDSLIPYFSMIMDDVNKKKFRTRLKVYLYNTSFNKNILKLKIFGI